MSNIYKCIYGVAILIYSHYAVLYATSTTALPDVISTSTETGLILHRFSPRFYMTQQSLNANLPDGRPLIDRVISGISHCLLENRAIRRSCRKRKNCHVLLPKSYWTVLFYVTNVALYYWFQWIPLSRDREISLVWKHCDAQE